MTRSRGFRAWLPWLFVCCTRITVASAWRMLQQDAAAAGGPLISNNSTRSVATSRDFLEALNDPNVTRVLLNGNEVM